MDYGYGVIKNMGFFSFGSIYVYDRSIASISPHFCYSEFEREQEMDRMRLSQDPGCNCCFMLSIFVVFEPPEHRRLSHASHG